MQTQNYDSRLSRLNNNPKCFYRELTKITGEAKNNSKFYINKDKLNRLQMTLIWPNHSIENLFLSVRPSLFHLKMALSRPTDAIGNNEKSILFYPADCTEISMIIKDLKNHKSPGLAGLTAQRLKVSPLKCTSSKFILSCEWIAKKWNINSGFKSCERGIDTQIRQEMNTWNLQTHISFDSTKQNIWTCCTWATI